MQPWVASERLLAGAEAPSRDSMSTKKYPAVLKYVGEKNDTVALEVQLGTRGHYRLRKCDFVPLKVYFDKVSSPHYAGVAPGRAATLSANVNF